MARSPLRAAPPRASSVEDLDLAPSQEPDAAQGGDVRPAPTVHRLTWRSWPGGAPAWAHGPAAAVVAVLVAAAAGGVVGAQHVRTGAAARLLTDRALLSLQAGAVVPLGGGVPGGPDPAGWSPLTVQVPLTDRGPDPVPVTVLGLTTAHQRTAARPEEVVVAPGGTTRVALPLRVRCDDVPGPDATWATTGSSPPAVRVRVRVPDGSREVRLVLVPDAAGSFQSQLSESCHPEAGTSPGSG